MRVMLVGTAFPMRGGIAHYVARLYKQLKARGHEVWVLSFRRQYPSLLFPGKTQIDHGKPLIEMPSNPLLDSINPVSWFRAASWVRNRRPDVLIFKYWMPFFAPCFAALAFLARRRGIRTIAICDNILPHERRPGDRILNRLGLKYMDGFIVQSETVQKDLLLFRPDAPWVFVPHPVYDLFPPAMSKAQARMRLGIQEDRVLLYFGYIRNYKGLRYAVEAMPALLKRMNVRLLICGEFYEGEKEILDLIRSNGLEDSVSLYTEFIPNEDVSLYFSAADLVVLPYMSATQSGIVQIAYHYEKPVLVTRVGGLPEVVPDGKAGFVVEPRDPAALADAVSRFYRTGETPFILGVREEKKKYSWDRMVDAIEGLIDHEGKD